MTFQHINPTISIIVSAICITATSANMRWDAIRLAVGTNVLMMPKRLFRSAAFGPIFCQRRRLNVSLQTKQSMYNLESRHSQKPLRTDPQHLVLHSIPYQNSTRTGSVASRPSLMPSHQDE